MSFTADTTLTQDAFVPLFDTASGSCYIGLKTNGPVLIHVASSLPAASVRSGIVLDKQGLMDVTLASFDEGDVVYGRCLDDEDNTVTVIGSGSAPA